MREQVQCENCKTMFPVNLKIQKLTDNIKRHFIKCSSCKTTYTAYYTDSEIRKLQSRQRVLRNDSTLTLTNDEKVKEFGENQQLIKEKMLVLRQKMEDS